MSSGGYPLPLHKVFQLVHNAALLLNSYEALRRYSQGHQFKRNESTEQLGNTGKCGQHQNYLLAKLTQVSLT